MSKRFVAVWFRYLIADRMIRRQPELRDVPFVVAAPEKGRMVVRAVSAAAAAKGIYTGMVAADCRAIYPALPVFDYQPGLTEQLLNALAEWCLCFTPAVAADLGGGLVLDVSGCPHLWGGEGPYLEAILGRLRGFGYHVRAGMADTIGAAWANSRYGKKTSIIEPGRQAEALLSLPPAALRIEAGVVERLEKLGLHSIRDFMSMPRKALRRRFGDELLNRLDQALGQEPEIMEPVQPVQPYQERLPSLEPIRTAKGIEIALRQLLDMLCKRLEQEQKGLRTCVLKCYRVDGNIQQVQVGTSGATRNTEHLFRLFEIRISSIQPALGIELFMLEATLVEDVLPVQDALWGTTTGNDAVIAELLDKLAGKVGMDTIHRYLPDEHYWPERSYKMAGSLQEKPASTWPTHAPRPLHLLPRPESIEVTVPIPDYPPMLFHHRGVLHQVKRADGPERIEQEWWLQQGLQRDYYMVEDENGARYWLFREGHYASGDPKWYLHGFFA